MPDAGTVEVNHRGTTYRASYSVKHRKVHLLTALGSKPPRALGTAQPQEIARKMLKEILHERDKR